MTESSAQRLIAVLPDTTSIGFVHLTVADLVVTGAFYQEVLGFRLAHQAGSTRYLSSDGGYPFHVVLTGRPEAKAAGRKSAGLYHYAVLYPSRAHLATALRRLLEVDWPIAGASDHGVSEAIYLADPEGNGIELYADRDRSRWVREHDNLVMTTQPLEVDELLTHAGSWTGMPEGARIGHVHLRVSDLGRAEAFYSGVLGFAVTVRVYPGALFFAAGGYHHHIGVNTWGGTQLAPADPDARGLRTFTIRLPDRAALAQAGQRLRTGHVPIDAATDHGRSLAITVRDPDRIPVTLEAPVPGDHAWQEAPVAVEALLRVLGAPAEAHRK
jgi:catechol 2,3-dioxygenase